MLKTISWISSVKLPCAEACEQDWEVECDEDGNPIEQSTYIADVVLCIESSLISAKHCEGSTDFTYKTIEASLINFQQVAFQSVSCKESAYKYVFEYDDAQLVEDSDPLECANIYGVFCKDCYTDWIEEIVGDEIEVVDNQDGTVTIVTQHGCQYTFSTGEGAQGPEGPQGPQGNPGIQGEQGEQGEQGPPGECECDNFISEDSGNLISVGTDNAAYIGCEDVVACLEVSECSDVLNCINVDSDSIDGDGSISTPFSVKLDPSPTNAIGVGANGLYVSAYTPVHSSMTALPDLASSGARVIRHTNGAGIQFQFTEGFSSVRQSTACNIAGVAANRAVRSIAISSGELIIDAAPEHTTLSGTVSIGLISPLFNPQNIHILNTELAVGETDVLTISNSTCRSVTFVYLGIFNIRAQVNTVGVWRQTAEINLNGAGYAEVAEKIWGAFPGIIGTNFEIVVAIPVTIAAGASLTLRARSKLKTLTASTAPAALYSASTQLTAIGSTVG